MEPYDVFRVISLILVWGIPAILVLGVLAFILLAPTLTFGGMASKLYEKLFRRQRRVVRQEPVATIGEMLKTARLPPEKSPPEDRKVIEKE